MESDVPKRLGYSHLAEQIADHDRYSEQFLWHLLHSIHDANGLGVLSGGGTTYFTPHLTRYFGLPETDIRDLAEAMREFYKQQGRVSYLLVGTFPQRKNR